VRPLSLRTEWAFVLRHCLQLAALPTLLTAVAAWLLATAARLPSNEATAATAATAALSGWLYLPQWVAGAACATALVRFAPLLPTRAPGAEVALRLARGPLQGLGAGIAATLLAQAILALPVTVVLAFALGAPGQCHEFTNLDAGAQPLLWTQSPRLALTNLPATAIDRLVLQPIAAAPTGPLAASRIQAVADGKLLASLPQGFSGSYERAQIDFAARRLQRLELVLEAGNVPLYFPPGSLSVRNPTAHSSLPNALLVALLGLVPAALALALGCLGGAVASLNTTLVLVLGAQAIMALGDFAGCRAACQSVLAGEGLGAATFFRQGAPSLLAGCLAMIGAMLLRRTTPR
jgi:hypothetical protein